MILQTAYMLIDGKFVAMLGKEPLGALGLANQVLMLLMAFSNAIGVGSTALVARFIGANEQDDAENAARQSILLAVASAFVSGVLLFLLGPSVIKAMAKEGADIPLGVLYLNIMLAGNLPSFLQVIVLGIYRGMGDMRTPLTATIAATIVNVVGDYLLIFGVGPIPQLGIAGAGMALIISRIVSTIILFVQFPKSQIRGILGGSWRPAWNWFLRILNIGYPVAIQVLLRQGAMMTYFGILSRTIDGQSARAALTIGLRMEGIAFMPGFAFSVAAASMVGQNIGARQPGRAMSAAWAATWQGIGVMGAIGLMFVVFSRPIAWFFADGNPYVTPLAASYLWINGLSEPFLAMGMVLTGALQGAGETRLPTLASILTLWVIRLPLTWLLAITFNMGSVGAWIAMSSSTVLSGLAILAIFKWNKWTQRKV